MGRRLDSGKPEEDADPQHIEESDAQDSKEVAQLVYASTQDSDWTLRDIVLLQIMGSIQHHHALESEMLQQLLRDLPDFTFDIASSKLVGGHKCSKCSHSLALRHIRCKCGCLNACSDAVCNKARTDRSMCAWCFSFGVVDFTKDCLAASQDQSS